MKDQQITPADILYSPADAARLGMANLERRRENKHWAVPFGLASIDKIYLPLLAGELECILARPGNGKTGIMVHRARHRAKLLAERGENRAVVYATCEQSIEDLWAFGMAAQTGISISDMARGEISDVQWLRIEGDALHLGTSPIWMIGTSEENRRKRPKLTANLIEDTIFHLEDSTKTKADIVFVDYLQLMKPDQRNQSKVIEMSEVLEACKDGAQHTGCGWSVAVQANRDVDKQAIQIPGADSGQWTSAIEQYADKLWSIVRPCKYRKQGETFGRKKVQGHSQALLSLLKQKLGIDNQAFWIYFDPAYNKLHELEEKYAVPDNKTGKRQPVFANGNGIEPPEDEQDED